MKIATIEKNIFWNWDILPRRIMAIGVELWVFVIRLLLPPSEFETILRRKACPKQILLDWNFSRKLNFLNP